VQVVAEKIRDRREAVFDGRVMPSTIPNFPVRQSLVSCDDEEVQTYRIEITTDNVVKQSVPARFSSSEKEEYLAEFDMVDTEGEFIPPPPMTPRRTASKMQEQETKEEHQSKKKGGGLFSSLRKRTYSLEDSKNGVEIKMSEPAEVESTLLKEKMTVRDIVGAPPAVTKSIATETTSTPPQKKSGGMFSSLRQRTDSLEDSHHGEEVKVPGSSSPKIDSKDQAAPVAVAAATAPPVRTSTPPQKKSGGVFSSLRKRTYSLEDSHHGKEVKVPGSSSPKLDSKEQTAPVAVAAVTAPPVRTSTPPQKKSGGVFSSLRKRTYSLEDSNHGIVKVPGSSTPKTDSKDQVVPATTDPSIATQMARQGHMAVDLDAELIEEEGDVPDLPSTKSYASSENKDVTITADKLEATTADTTKSTPVEHVAPTQKPKSVSAEAKPATETKSVPVVIRQPILSNSPKRAPTGPTNTTTKVEDSEPNPAETIEPETPDTSKPKSSKQDDDTKSTASSSTEAIMATKPRDKFYGEAAVERILEKFFDKVTCSCISNQCVGNEPAEKEVPNYMVVEIQKIHQKAQAKKSEIAEKREARKVNKSKKGPWPSRKMKDKKSSNLKKDKSNKKEFEMNAEKKGVPTYEWGEKVLEQDSVTTASSAHHHDAGVTVGQFLKKRFDLFEKSIRRGEKEVPADESSQSVETLVDDSDVDEGKTVKNNFADAILNITPMGRDMPESGALRSKTAKRGSKKNPEERVILLAPAGEDGSESLLDGTDEEGESLLDDEESEYTTELIQVDFDPSKLGNTTDADMYLAREVLRRYAEITGISLDELIEDVVDESLASLTLDAYGFPLDRNGDDSTQ
jgi:hypothetical protein